MISSTTYAPDAAAIERMAHDAVNQLPEMFRHYLTHVIFSVEEFASDEILKEMGIDNPWELTGLYQGRPLSEESIWSAGDLPPMIFLFRCPLLNEWVETGIALEDLVTHVVVHEVGHHFGLSDAEMDAIEKNEALPSNRSS